VVNWRSGGGSEPLHIDPPYNTGKDFVYKDNFKDNIKNYKEITGQVDSEGRNLSNNPETSGRYHTDWLNMMYPRLKLARNLLKDEGVIFISIDDNEQNNIRKLCDEIFGEENFIANVIWQRAFSPKNDAKYLSENHDYVLIYCKSSERFEAGRLPRSEAANARYKNLDNDPRGVWISDNLTVKTYSEKYDYPITTPSSRIVNPAHGSCWRVSKEKFQELVEDSRIWFGEEGGNVPRLKRFLSEVQDGMVATTLWLHQEVGHNQEGRQEVKALFDDRGYFDGPKPVRLLNRILQIANTGEEDIILDFFSGSATTAHAVMQFNSEEGGNRKFVMVQLPETTEEKSEAYKAGYKTIAEISKERIRRAAAKMKEKNPDYNGDLGFKVFKLDSTNIKPWEVDFDMTERTLEDFISNIKPDRREEDVLYEILLKYGLDLTLPISEHTIAGQKVFDIGMGALIICLADSISLDVVEGMAKLKEELNPEIMREVFKDSGFKDDVVKTNAVQILKQAGIVDVRSL
jgi:adenine-specific DNA-methyltransferase